MRGIRNRQRPAADVRGIVVLKDHQRLAIPNPIELQNAKGQRMMLYIMVLEQTSPRSVGLSTVLYDSFQAFLSIKSKNRPLTLIRER
jgi:hypothetical protein